MGWSYSPTVAQSLGWLLLHHREPEEEMFFDLSGSKAAPMFVYLKNAAGNTCGMATIYYDNYIVVGTDPRMVETMHHRIERNAKLFHVELKEHNMYSRKQLVVRNDDTVLKFLGVRIGFQIRRDRQGQPSHHLVWRADKTLPQIGRAHV